MAKSQWADPDTIGHILAALTPPNRLACLVSLHTGLRIGDVLALKTEQLTKERFTVREEKTGKTRRIRLPNALRDDLLKSAGRIFVFEGRTDHKKHRTRQAVLKDLQRARRAFRVKARITPHSMRKCFSVEIWGKYGDIKRIQKLLNHSDEPTTLIYALADQLSK